MEPSWDHPGTILESGLVKPRVVWEVWDEALGALGTSGEAWGGLGQRWYLYMLESRK